MEFQSVTSCGYGSGLLSRLLVWMSQGGGTRFFLTENPRSGPFTFVYVGGAERLGPPVARNCQNGHKVTVGKIGVVFRCRHDHT